MESAAAIGERFCERHFRPLSVALLATMALAMFTSALRESPTWDENYGAAAGYMYWHTGDYSMIAEHPALSKLLSGLPLLALDLEIPGAEAVWTGDRAVAAGRKFVYENRAPAERILLYARCSSILFILATGFLLGMWTRRRFGAPVALLALAFYCLDPNLIAHGRYITSDAFITGFTWLACIAWSCYLEARTWPRMLLAGALLGCALGSKMPALILLGVFPLLHLLHGGPEPSAGPAARVRRLAVDTAACFAVALAVLALIYAPEVKAYAVYVSTGRKTLPFLDRPLAETAWPGNPAGAALRWMGVTFHLPTFNYLMSLNLMGGHMASGHTSYLLGQFSQKGWWYYFPVAMIVKTPTATLLLLALGLGLAASRRISCWRAIRFDYVLLAAPPAVYLAAAMALSNVNIGYRHILPALPFLFVLGAGLAVELGPRRLGRAFAPAIAALIALLAAESASIYPHYLAFFNWPSGGPASGSKYLLDSNLDWGQDLIHLSQWAKPRNIGEVCLEYFGTALPHRYGLVVGPLPGKNDAKAWRNVDCVVAVSATPLFGLYVPRERFEWLRAQRPVAKIGYSIYAYDLRKTPHSQEREPATAGTYDNVDPRFRYSLGWTHDLKFPRTAGGTVSYSALPGASVRFAFRGTEITWAHTKAFNRGMAEVLIDGVSRGTVDLYSKSIEWQCRLTYGGLIDGPHRMEIRNVGRRNAQSSDTYVDVDQFEVR